MERLGVYFREFEIHFPFTMIVRDCSLTNGGVHWQWVNERRHKWGFSPLLCTYIQCISPGLRTQSHDNLLEKWQNDTDLQTHSVTSLGGLSSSTENNSIHWTYTRELYPVVATLDQRHWRWFNVSTTSCALRVKLPLVIIRGIWIFYTSVLVDSEYKYD